MRRKERKGRKEGGDGEGKRWRKEGQGGNGEEVEKDKGTLKEKVFEMGGESRKCKRNN